MLYSYKDLSNGILFLELHKGGVITPISRPRLAMGLVQGHGQQWTELWAAHGQLFN